MAGVNKVILVGNLGKDPDIRNLESGSKVANFSLATTEFFKGKDGNRTEQTEWHNISVWNQLADLSEKYLKKGDKIYLEGRIRTRSYDDKDGVKKYITEIIGNQMTFLGSPQRSNDNQNNSSVSKDEPLVNDMGEGDGDLPF
ncbi:MAG: single-stranded DNA-binding protein [Bacteroidota bacterium]